MGGLSIGGSKKSSNFYDNTLTNTDYRSTESGNIGGNVTLAAGAVINGGVQMTDFGALDMAGDLSERAFSQVQNSIDAVRTVASDSTATIAQALNKVTDFATKQTGTDQNQTVQYLIMGAALVLAIWVYRS